MRIRTGFLVLLLASGAWAQSTKYLYPVAWPKAGGGMLVAVPLADANVSVFRMVGTPHTASFNTPFPLGGTPELTLTPAPHDQPIVLWAPVLTTMANADEDDVILLVSDQRLVVSMADDERWQPGTPDRIFFMPADNGTFKGRTFYSGANGGDPSELLRVTNFGTVASTATVYSWESGAWVQVGTFSVPPGTDATFDPPDPQNPYKVVTTEDSMVVVGYMYDNATAPAADIATGLPVGSQLYGYGVAWHLRAVQALSYVVETRAPGSTSWTQVATGSLAADEGFGDVLPGGGTDSYIRITLTGGVGWAIMGTPSLLGQTEWDGYYLPTQSPNYCTVGTTFITNSSSRTVTLLPKPGTTVTSYDAATGVMVDTYTSVGAFEFHNAFHNAPTRVEITNGVGSVLLVGTLDWGGCDEAVDPGNCGILEGGYSLPALAAFSCNGEIGNTGNCGVSIGASCGGAGGGGGSTGTGGGIGGTGGGSSGTGGGVSGTGGGASGVGGGSSGAGGGAGTGGGASGTGGGASSAGGGTASTGGGSAGTGGGVSGSTGGGAGTATGGGSASGGGSAVGGGSGATGGGGGGSVSDAGMADAGSAGGGGAIANGGTHSTASAGCCSNSSTAMGLQSMAMGVLLFALRRRRRS
ncbi:MAG: hypothetical protein QM723_19350 [Myxococcaceae bacterium]